MLSRSDTESLISFRGYVSSEISITTSSPSSVVLKQRIVRDFETIQARLAQSVERQTADLKVVGSMRVVAYFSCVTFPTL